MSIILVGKAQSTQLHGDSTAKLLLLTLANYANHENQAWPSIQRLSGDIEKSERTVQLALRKLEQLGLICQGNPIWAKALPKGQRPTVYEILPSRNKQDDRKRRAGVHPASPLVDGTPSEQTGAMGFTPTGEAHCIRGVKPSAGEGCNTASIRGEAHCTQTVIEPSLEPSGESTRTRDTTARPSDQTEQRTLRLLALTPSQDHQALADEYGLDLDWELGKFQDDCLANGKPPHDPDRAFSKWLKRGRELGIGRPAATPSATTGAAGTASPDGELNRRARKLLETSTPLKHVQPDLAERMQWLPQVRRMLAEGDEPAHIVQLIVQAAADWKHPASADELDSIA
jgi:hypothetical protein